MKTYIEDLKDITDEELLDIAKYFIDNFNKYLNKFENRDKDDSMEEISLVMLIETIRLCKDIVENEILRRGLIQK